MRVFRRISTIQPLARAITVISAVAVLTTGVTFAALQSQNATLTGNSIHTATADLKIGTSASTFSASRTGFSFNSIVPGAVPSPTEGNSFYLKNYGTAPMALKVSVGTTPTNVANVDLSKVFLTITRVDSSASQKLSLASLVAAHTTGGVALTDNLAGGIVAQYKVQASMTEDAFNGMSAEVEGIDLVFYGTVVAQ